jgi:hypothetical protein
MDERERGARAAQADSPGTSAPRRHCGASRRLSDRPHGAFLPLRGNTDTLYDDGNDEPLLWRRQGDDWDEPEGADGNPAGAAGATEQTFTMAEVSAAIDMHNRLAGVTAEQRSAEALAALPPERQRHVAAGLQDFARALEKGVEELMRRKGPGHVVNVDDVAEMKKAWERDAASRFAG